MAFESEGILSGIIISFIVGTVLLIANYVLWHKNKLGPLNLWKTYRPIRPHDKPTLFNFKGFGTKPSNFFPTFFGIRDPWHDSQQGELACLYTYLMKAVAQMLLIVAFVFCAILIPVNASSDHNCRQQADEWVKKAVLNKTEGPFECVEGVADWTSRNLKINDGRWVGLLICSIIMAYEIWGLVWNVTNEIRRAKARMPFKRTLIVHNTTKESEGAARKQVTNLIPEEQRKFIERIDVPRVPVKGMEDLIDEHDGNVKKLQRLYAICQEEGIGESEMLGNHKKLIGSTGKLPCGKKANLIGHNRDLVDTQYKKLNELKGKIDSQPLTGVCFVTFTDGKYAAQVHVEKENNSDLAKHNVKFAPEAKHILWDTIGTPKIVRTILGIFTFFVILFLVLIWGRILGFVGGIDAYTDSIAGLSWLANLTPEIRGLFSTYLPIIAIAVLNALIPIFFRLWSHKVERVGHANERETMVMRKLFGFGFGTAVVLQAAFKGITEAMIADDFVSGVFFIGAEWKTSVSNVLAQVIVPSSGFFPVVVLMAAFVGNLVAALLIGPVAVSFIFGEKLSKTVQEQEDGYTKGEFMFGQDMGFMLVTLSIVILFGINAPYIVLFGFFFAIIKFLVIRAVLTDSYQRCRDNDLRMIFSAVKIILLVFVIAQLFGVSLLTLNKEAYIVSGISWVPFIISCVLLIWLHFHGYYMFRTGLTREVLEARFEDRFTWPTVCNLIGGKGDPLQFNYAGEIEEVNRHLYLPRSQYYTPKPTNHVQESRKHHQKAEMNYVQEGIAKSLVFFPTRHYPNVGHKVGATPGEPIDEEGNY